ncbi:MAG: hypothetical protein QOH25_3329 [Acidobacteriota bacterium]|jgi:hypothetical protein|nr:hypothetical protein [Acidobacteriota bacterium]
MLFISLRPLCVLSSLCGELPLAKRSIGVTESYQTTLLSAAYPVSQQAVSI